MARSHYQAAVDAGLNEARLRLAFCHLEGWGGPVDRPAFVREIRTAAEANYFPAQRILATMCFIGFAVPENRPEGMKWLERAALHDDLEAQYRLGRQAERISRLALAPDLKLARTWYQLSAEKEYRDSMRAMASTFLNGSRSDRNWELGQRWLLLATENGDEEAPYVLAICELLHVDAPHREEDKARAWLKLASERTNVNASEVLELEIGGRTLADAMRYLLTVPFEDRYVQQAAANVSDAATRPPVVYRIVRPIYPQSLRMTNISGEVLVDFVVDTTGRVINPFVVKAAHPLFGERAIEAVYQWRFHPARQNDHLVNSHMQVPVIFTLTNEDIGGVDGRLRYAAQRAQQLGPEVLADASELRVGVPTKRLPKPKLPDGSDFGSDSSAMILLVLDPRGRPLRGHVLRAQPEALGPALLSIALGSTFVPRMLNGEAIGSNILLTFSASRTREPVLRTK